MTLVGQRVGAAVIAMAAGTLLTACGGEPAAEPVDRPFAWTAISRTGEARMVVYQTGFNRDGEVVRPSSAALERLDGATVLRLRTRDRFAQPAAAAEMHSCVIIRLPPGEENADIRYAPRRDRPAPAVTGPAGQDLAPGKCPSLALTGN